MDIDKAKRDAQDALDNAANSASADQAKGKSKQFVGKIKETIGNALGDDELAAKGTLQRADGKKDEIKGDIKEKIDDAKSAIKGAAEIVRDKFNAARH